MVFFLVFKKILYLCIVFLSEKRPVFIQAEQSGIISINNNPLKVLQKPGEIQSFNVIFPLNKFINKSQIKFLITFH